MIDDLLVRHAGDPIVLAALLFLAPFVLEEAAILMGAGIAVAGELPAAVAAGALYLGIVVSDWLLFIGGAWAARSGRIRGWIGTGNIDKGRRLLERGTFLASLSARLVPWLLMPIFVACGFVGIGFARFAFINAVIALVYLNVLFWAAYGFNLVLLDLFARWGWVLVVGFAIAIVLATRIAGRRWGKPKD